MSEDAQMMLAVIEADNALTKALLAESLVLSKRPNQAADANRKVRQSIELALRAHRRGGCSSTELLEMERVAEDIKELAK